MKRIVSLGLLLMVVVGFTVSPLLAGEMTLSGSILCAKCKLKKADAKECQDVLVVTDDEGETAEYYIAKNQVSEEFGHVCSGVAEATVTGEVAEEDGKMWISPSKMEKPS